MDIIKKQLLLFKTIQSNYKNKRSFISSIKKLLPYQKSSLYKRLRGDAYLTIDELVCLAKQYNLSLDAMFELKTNSFVFEYPDNMLSSDEPYLNYLNQLQQILVNVQQLNEVELLFQSNEMPFFYYLKFPDLAYFKLYLYFNTSWKNPDFPIQKFDLKTMRANHSMNKIMKEIHLCYRSIPRKEYWPANPHYYMILQIFSLLKAKMFVEEEEAMSLLDLLLKINQNMSSKLVSTINKKDKIMDLFANDLNTQNEMILVNSQSEKFILKSINSPNLVKSTDIELIHLSQQWFDRTEDLSTCLTKGNRLKLPNYFKNQEEYLLRAKVQLKEQLFFSDRNIIH